MSNPWPAVVSRVVAVVAFAGVLGSAAGHPAAGIAAGALGCLGWYLFLLYRLERWLSGDPAIPPPRHEGILGTITEQVLRLRRRNRKRKRKLAKVLNRYQKAASALPDAAVALDGQGQIVWCNGAATRLLGLRTPEDAGRPIVNLVRNPAFVAFLASDDPGESVEFPGAIDDGVLLSARIIPYGRSQRLVLAEDISRLRHLEQVRSDFVANVSHELRTPLTVITGYLETLAGDCAASGPLRQMSVQARRMRRIIEDLLMLSRMEGGRPAPVPAEVSMAALIDSVVEDARELSASSCHRIEREVDEGLRLLGHEQELRSVVANLAFNAVRYTPAQGRIAIRWYADERGAHLEVADDGEGIAAEHLPRLTERFYRVDRGRSRAGGGTGLGLAIVKHVLTRHRAGLHIESSPGEGSTFRCEFPPELVARRPQPRPLLQVVG